MSERTKELKVRRKRRQKLNRIKAKLPKMDAAAKTATAEKLRRMTPGAEGLIKVFGLE